MTSERERSEWAEAQRAQWAKIARLGECVRAAEQRSRWERERGREEHAQAKERARAEEESARSEHARSSHFLLAIAVRLLPPSERDRYLEEFRAELLDIPRDTQLSHALSLLRGAFVLRLRRGLTKPTDVAVRRANDVPSTRST
jgi:hypothetical protein